MPKRTGSGIVPTSSTESLGPNLAVLGRGLKIDVREQTTRNLGLIRDVIERELDGEFELDPQPEGVRLILLPMDDAELAHANLDMAIALANQGEQLQIQLVPPRKPDRKSSSRRSLSDEH